MTIRLVSSGTLLTLALAFSNAAGAQGLQPGMRTMIQQGGIEPGPLLGAILPGYGAAPYGGFVPEPNRWEYARPIVYEREPVPLTRRRLHRHRHALRTHRHHFAR